MQWEVQTSSGQDNENSMTFRATCLTLFPEAFPGILGVSIVGTALRQGIWQLDTVDIREHGVGKHRNVDDTPSGGGAGMVMRADVAAAAIDSVEHDGRPRIYLSPRGKPLTQARVRELAAGPGLILLCGRFEGLDERVIEGRELEEVSLGDFVLAGGEVAAQADRRLTAPDADVALDLLPARARGLAVASRDLFARAHAADTALAA